jgi:hypothetical protein
LVREAIEGQIGMLTCQVIDLNVRLRVMQDEMVRMDAVITERDAEIALLKKVAPKA